MARKPRRSGKQKLPRAARGLLVLHKRIGTAQVAKRLKVKPATISRWLKKGVPESRKDSVELLLVKNDRARAAAATRARRTEIRERLSATTGVDIGSFMTNLASARRDYRAGDLDITEGKDRAARLWKSGGMQEMADELGVDVQEIYTIFIYSGGDEA